MFKKSGKIHTCIVRIFVLKRLKPSVMFRVAGWFIHLKMHRTLWNLTPKEILKEHFLCLIVSVMNWNVSIFTQNILWTRSTNICPIPKEKYISGSALQMSLFFENMFVRCQQHDIFYSVCVTLSKTKSLKIVSYLKNQQSRNIHPFWKI